MHRLVIAIAALGGCGTTALPAGAVCKQTADCEADLMCLDIAQINGTTCTVVGKACSVVCLDDMGCAMLGPKFKCFAGCGTDKFCGATQ
jgi:hypothetical protein